MISIVFLDIDGVLCTHKSIDEPKLPFPEGFYMPFRMGWDRLDKECVKRLNEIIEATDAKIVISSTWRLSCSTDWKFGYLTGFLFLEGVRADIIDKTPSHYIQLYNGLWGPDKERINNRKSEIQQWFDNWDGEPIESFVILDDWKDMGNLSSSHVCPDESVGLQDCDVKKAIQILNG